MAVMNTTSSHEQGDQPNKKTQPKLRFLEKWELACKPGSVSSKLD